MTTSPAERLSQAEAPALRAAISRLATRVPGAIFGSGDMNPASCEEPPLRGVTTPLMLIASRAAARIPDRHILSYAYEGPDSHGEVYGDWSVTIERQDGQCEVDGTAEVDGESDLAACDPESIRAALSALSGQTPFTLYPSDDIGRDLGQKETREGQEIDEIGQAAMFACSTMRHHLAAGDTVRFALDGLVHGMRDVTRWIVTLERHSA